MPAGDFNRIPGMIRNLRPMLANEAEEAAKDTYREMVNQWERGQTAQGEAWQPLHPRTIAEKGHDKILIDEGDMIDSAGYEVDSKNLTAEIYVEDMPKIAYHEFGTERIPRRPVLGPTHPLFVSNTEEAVAKAVDKSVARASLTGGVGGLLRSGKL